MQGIARPVVVQREHKAHAGCHIGPAHRLGCTGVFVDVVAQENHRIQIFIAHVAVGTVVAVFPALARGIGQPQARYFGTGQGKGARVPRGADRIAHHKAVVVPAVRLQAGHLHMHRIAQCCAGQSLPPLHNAAELCVMRQLPLHRDRFLMDAFRRQARPQHHPVGRG